MIAASLFLVVVVYGLGSLVNSNLIHRRSQDMRAILDSLSFVMEDMSRNLRTGYNYKCYSAPATLPLTGVGVADSCDSGWALAFEYAYGNPLSTADQWIYYINLGKIYKSTDGGATYVQMTPDEVTIDQAYAFSVLGAEAPSGGNFQQPLVTIKLIGRITYKNIITPFSLQTSMSQRLIDI